ncbi:SH2 domain-containing adapter protein B isoform X4 [Apteryx rowi]|uniref:SH2 domain-containing adapter protein B isoform X4 n=1 Tax=Apteryx rowi TaxID=308060 RepID=UPI000E1CB454|nr:SH2 domain-containing adapter protein B isoform X4 [Apteryx rowi]
MQLYDTPYEPEGSGVESDSESVVSQHLRESKLPQDDDRPADEYDQPWEWNKVTIPALAAQFNGSEKRQASPSPSNDQRRQLRAPGGGFKPFKHGSPEFCGILGERIDPTIPLEKQIWYHGAISRTDAENLLRLCKECSYLVRNSQTSKHDYSLSLKISCDVEKPCDTDPPALFTIVIVDSLAQSCARGMFYLWNDVGNHWDWKGRRAACFAGSLAAPT